MAVRCTFRGKVPLVTDTASMTSRSSPTKSLRILCVDDEPAIRSVVAAHLQRRGHEVEVAANGFSGWETIAASPTGFDVVITDCEMPKLGGLGLVELLCEARFPGRIVVFSSSLSPHHREKFLALGVDAIVEKGRPFEELLVEVEHSGHGATQRERAGGGAG